MKTQFVNVSEGRIAFDDTGSSGPLVLAIPAMGDLRTEYRFLRPLLVRAGYRVVTMDIRGMGETSAIWSDYSARAIGADALAVIRQLSGVGEVIVMGTSFAAGSALWAARMEPRIVHSVVLISPVLKDYPLGPLQRAAVAIGFSGPWRASFWLGYWNSLFTVPPPDHGIYRAALRSNLGEAGRMTALRTMVALSKADTDAIADATTTPALVIMGGKDRDFRDPRDEAEKIAARIRADLTFLPDVGHYPQVEAAEETAAAILAFLGKTRTR